MYLIFGSYVLVSGKELLYVSFTLKPQENRRKHIDYMVSFASKKNINFLYLKQV